MRPPTSASRNTLPVPCPVCRIEVGDRVGEAAGLPHHRHGAVAHRVHLGQAAGLVQRRHQHQVAARKDAVRKPLVVRVHVDDAARELEHELAQRLDVARLAVAEECADERPLAQERRQRVRR